jgi:hypothetical protein
MSETANWTTRLDPGITRQYGVEEIHGAFFEPPGWLGKGATISLGLPECEVQVALPDPQDENSALVGWLNRGGPNQNVKHWISKACQQAAKIKGGAALIVSCDTAEQIEIAARRVAKLLPQYSRMSVERFYEAKNRCKAGLS